MSVPWASAPPSFPGANASYLLSLCCKAISRKHEPMSPERWGLPRGWYVENSPAHSPGRLGLMGCLAVSSMMSLNTLYCPETGHGVLSVEWMPSWEPPVASWRQLVPSPALDSALWTPSSRYTWGSLPLRETQKLTWVEMRGDTYTFLTRRSCTFLLVVVSPGKPAPLLYLPYPALPPLFLFFSPNSYHNDNS